MIRIYTGFCILLSQLPVSYDRHQDYTRAQELAADEGSSEEVSQLLREAKVALKKSKRVDYYALLEVAVDASATDIKKGFRRACLKWHPDKVGAAICFTCNDCNVMCLLPGQGGSSYLMVTII